MLHVKSSCSFNQGMQESTLLGEIIYFRILLEVRNSPGVFVQVDVLAHCNVSSMVFVRCVLQCTGLFTNVGSATSVLVRAPVL